MTGNTKLFALLVVLLLIPVVSCGTSEQENESGVREESAIEQEATQEERKADELEETEETKEDSDEEMKDEDSEESKNEESDELDEELVTMGEKVYQEKACSSCHTFGKGRLVGPDLLGATERRDEEWLKKWIKNPDEMLRTDPVAKELLKEYMVPMPNQGLTDEEVAAVLEYMKHKDQTN